MNSEVRIVHDGAFNFCIFHARARGHIVETELIAPRVNGDLLIPLLVELADRRLRCADEDGTLGKSILPRITEVPVFMHLPPNHFGLIFSGANTGGCFRIDAISSAVREDREMLSAEPVRDQFAEPYLRFYLNRAIDPDRILRFREEFVAE